MSIRIDDVLKRLDPVRSCILNPNKVPATLYAREDVGIETEGVEQLLEFMDLQGTLGDIYGWQKAGRIQPFWGDEPGSMDSVVITPDFHRGGSVPIGTVANCQGFVIPSAVGNDVCCGMRLLTTDVTKSELAPHLDALGHALRSIFFKGQRDIPMSPRQREALIRRGLWGLHETAGDNAGTGLWKDYDPKQQELDLDRVHFQGVLPTNDIFGFQDFIRASGRVDGRDPQIGSVGGGNHFVELQSVDEICDGVTAHDWNLSRDSITIMAHSGSLGLGHMVGGHYCGKAHSLYPQGVPHPKHGFYVIPTRGPHAALAQEYLDAMRNAANFAFGNRLCLGLMVVRALSEVLNRPVHSSLVYDAPHNLIWEPEGTENMYLHRKGACPALGPTPTMSGPFKYSGHPVIIPGSMGSSSYVLAGEGNTDALSSACHGAGRSLTRGRASHVDDGDYAKSMESIRVITPIDPDSVQVRSRPDILAAYHHRVKQEAPYAYKSVGPVVQTVEDAGIARRVVRLWPIMTVKG